MFPFYHRNSFAPTPIWNNIAPARLPAPPAPLPPQVAPAPPLVAIEFRHRIPHIMRAQKPTVAVFSMPKTVHINTYALRLVNTEPVALQEVCEYRPEGLETLLTVDCMTWRSPPKKMCETWSGVSPEIKGFMKGVRTARKAMRVVVEQTVQYLLEGHDAALLEVCCVEGTHRSVAIAELIGEKLSKMGIDTYVTHIHRVRRPGDAY